MPVAYRNSDFAYKANNTTVTLAKPSGTEEGDVMLAVFIGNDSSRTLNTLPSGWAIAQDDKITGRAAWVAWKKAGASEPSSYDFVFNFAFNGGAGIISYSGGDTVNVSGETGWTADASGPWTPTAPSITTTVDDCLKVWIAGFRWTPTGSASAFTEPSGYTERAELGSSGWGVGLSIADDTQETAGASGTAAGSVTNATATGAGIYAAHVAISPAVSSYTARPDDDVSAGTWTASAGSDLFAMLDEEVASDVDYITATSAGTCEVALSAMAEPLSGYQTKVRYRIKGDVTVRLVCDTTVIAEWAHSPGPGSETTYEQVLTSGEQSTIADWADLRLRFVKP